MVHALKQIWRTLKPGGLLLDLRPYSANCPVEVVAGDRMEVAGRIDDSAGLPDDEAASAAIGRAAHEGWFRLEQSGSFDFMWGWDDLEEMCSYVEEKWADWLNFPLDARRNAARLMREMGASQVRIRLNMIIARYQKSYETNPFLPRV